MSNRPPNPWTRKGTFPEWVLDDGPYNSYVRLNAESKRWSWTVGVQNPGRIGYEVIGQGDASTRGRAQGRATAKIRDAKRLVRR